MNIPSNKEADNGSKYLSENETEYHHRDEFPEKEINIQTHAKFEQKNPEELKNSS